MGNETLLRRIPQINLSGSGISGPLTFSPAENELLTRVDGVASLEEIGRKSGLPEDLLLQAAENLISRRFILVAEAVPAEAKPALPLQPKPAAAAEVIFSSRRSNPMPAPTRTEEGDWNLDGVIGQISLIHRQKQSGQLILRGPSEQERTILFREGQLLTVSSKPVDASDLIGNFFRQLAMLPIETLESALDNSRKFGRPLGNELLSQGKISKEILTKGLQLQFESRLKSIFSWNSGKYSWAEIRMPASGSALGIPLQILLFDFLWKNYTDEAINVAMRPFRDSAMKKATQPPFDPHNLRLGKHVHQFWHETLGQETLFQKVMLSTRMRKDHLQRMVWVLYKMGLLEFFDDSQETKSKADLEALAGKVRHNERGNAFDVLGVHWSAADRDLLAAYEKNKKFCETEMQTAVDMRRHLVEELQRQLEKAYDRVKNYDERQKYRAELFEESYIINYAEVLQRKAESYLFSKDDYEQTVVEAESSLEIYPKNAEALCLLGIGQFCSGYGRDRSLTVSGRKNLERGYYMMPKSILANLCMGMMYKRERNIKSAQKYYYKILEIKPGNLFARIELQELETGKKDKDRDKIIGDFLNGRKKKN